MCEASARVEKTRMQLGIAEDSVSDLTRELGDERAQNESLCRSLREANQALDSIKEVGISVIIMTKMLR